MALIDAAIVQRLVAARFATVATATIPAAAQFYPGDTVPDGLSRWARLIRIDILPQPRSRSGTGQDEPDLADLVVTIGCGCSRSQMETSSHSLASVLAEVYRVMSQACLIESTHQVDLVEARMTADKLDDDLTQPATGAVIITGTVCRTSGATMTPLIA